jgi:Cof subfamily protein (haloacid dehalogenase superfamily)
MGERPALVASDLDGTLLRSDLSISPRTRAALAAVEAAGALLVFVTGRPPRWLHPVAVQIDHRGLAICANGALLYDLHTEKLIDSQLIPADTIARVVELMSEHVPGVGFALEYGNRFVFEANYPVNEGIRRHEAVQEVDLDGLVREPAAKILVQHTGIHSNDLLAAGREVLEGLVEVTHSTPVGPGLLEISAAGVSKATALARFAAQHGIDAADVVAFGDMPNDLAMLAWAGRGYAMADAHPDLHAACELRAPSNDEDGVAAVLEEMFGLTG